jgi:hypothetical protein
MSEPDFDERAFHEGREAVWIPQDLMEADLAYQAGDPKPLANYIRAHGVPRIYDQLVAELLETVGTRTRLNLRTREILRFLKAARLHYANQKSITVGDPNYQPRFQSVRQIHEYAAKRFLGDSNQWMTVLKLEQRHKR